MSEYSQYRRSQIAELRPYVPGEIMRDVSVSSEDEKAGSPKLGDMIARNPKNHADKWLVAARYFADNFEPISIPTVAATSQVPLAWRWRPKNNPFRTLEWCLSVHNPAEFNRWDIEWEPLYAVTRPAPDPQCAADARTTIENAPPPLKRLGARLAGLLGADDWNNIEPLLLEVAAVSPSFDSTTARCQCAPPYPMIKGDGKSFHCTVCGGIVGEAPVSRPPHQPSPPKEWDRVLYDPVKNDYVAVPQSLLKRDIKKDGTD